MTARESLLNKIMESAAEQGIAGKSLREIAAGAGTSHRMLLYHFGSREGLMAAIVAAMEVRQRAAMQAMSQSAAGPVQLMTALWKQVSDPQLRPFVRLFFEVLGQAAQGEPGTEAMLEGLTEPWLDDALATAHRLGYDTDRHMMRLGVAVTRGLLIDLLAGADPAEVDAAYARFTEAVSMPS